MTTPFPTGSRHVVPIPCQREALKLALKKVDIASVVRFGSILATLGRGDF